MDFLILILIIVNISNVLSVWFAAKNNRLTWGVGFIGVAIMSIIFFLNGHYMSFAFNVYSAIVCIIGHFRWDKDVEQNDKAICWSKPLTSIILCLLLSVIIYFINVELSQNPFLDSVGTSIAIVAAYLLTKQDINAWILYLVSDVIYIYLGIVSGEWQYSIVYGVMMIIAIYGTREFIIKYRQNEKDV